MTRETIAKLTVAVREALEVVGIEAIRKDEFFGTNERRIEHKKAA